MIAFNPESESNSNQDEENRMETTTGFSARFESGVQKAIGEMENSGSEEALVPGTSIRVRKNKLEDKNALAVYEHKGTSYFVYTA